MKNQDTFNWLQLITVDEKWISQYLSGHPVLQNNKIILRTYSIQFTGTKYDTVGFVDFVINSIVKYVLSDKEIKQLEEKNKIPFLEAMRYFGDVNPTFDGKYGELILYLFIEAVLKVPLVSFKIPTNANDQIKGGDGIFFGDYNNNQALLIGESKTWQSLDNALKDAFESLNKFYNPADTSIIGFEYFVAKKNMRPNLSKEELDYLYNCLTPGTEEYKNKTTVHPVLIIHDEPNIGGISAENNFDGENKIKALLEKSANSNLDRINKLCEK